MAQNFNGYNFDSPKTLKRMRYLVIMDGDLDLNNAYGFKSKRDLDAYLREEHGRKTLAVFRVAPLPPNVGGNPRERSAAK